MGAFVGPGLLGGPRNYTPLTLRLRGARESQRQIRFSINNRYNRNRSCHNRWL
jgi:hypothetical protein